MTSDIEYFRRRAIQEQVAAQKAACPTARAIHNELAAAYRFQVSILSHAWSEAGMAIALQRLSHQQFPQLPNTLKWTITAVPSASATRHDQTGAVCLGG